MATVTTRLQPFAVSVGIVAVAALGVSVHQQFTGLVLGDPVVEAPAQVPPPRAALPYVEPYRPPSAEEQALSVAIAAVPARLAEGLRFERIVEPAAAAARPQTPAPQTTPGTVAADAPAAPVVSVYRPVRWRPPAKPATAVRTAPVEAPVAERFDPLVPWFLARDR